MKIFIITLFPEIFEPLFKISIIGRAAKKGLVEFEIINLRDFGAGRHQVVDGRPFGGGVGMILRADILASAWKSAVTVTSHHTILMSASGVTYRQGKARDLSRRENLIIICGHYEGVDQRFIDKYVDEEISIGDYVLTGGEIPAMAVIDSVVRLIPQVLKKEEATDEESFSPSISGQLEYPQYTRPQNFNGLKVPDVLTSGNHKAIEEWKKANSKPLI